jgi:hypothetical protein
MKRVGLLVAGLLAIGSLAESRGQVPIFPPPPGPVIRVAPPFGFSFGGARRGPYGASITIITTTTRRPSSIDSSPPPAADTPQQGDNDLIDPLVIKPRPKGALKLPDFPDGPPLPPGAPAGGFRPVRPEDRMRAQQPVPPDEAPPKVDPKNLPPRPDKPPRVPEPERHPKDEAARQVQIGKLAFAAQEYGRAAERFRDATRIAPREPTAYFLLAEAELALGKYREAVAAIHDGLRLKPDWPFDAFQPVELYGPNVPDHDDHIKQLREALERNPRDPALLFLTAYQLWFDGRQDEARPLFRKALPLVTDPRFIHLFLDGKGGLRIAAR